jgi:hypothetical protein
MVWWRLMKGRAADPAVATGWPTLHVTHRKAGSQWLRRILYNCAPERVVFAEYEMAQFPSDAPGQDLSDTLRNQG